eukprot:NODE_1689_length_1091_cov_277.904990_g1376_i0.p3 GENE.NODE_1689_length_1091_cov_277.904990_g1376_i0~~NODE_1689_length_1091_cov_277.904990_g1376_i0.p3  ORF type:complete len:87 (+),score=35.77 NODE_1689_length_1091_cov_277.904990_g1376_i0:738-998(+)
MLSNLWHYVLGRTAVKKAYRKYMSYVHEGMPKGYGGGHYKAIKARKSAGKKEGSAKKETVKKEASDKKSKPAGKQAPKAKPKAGKK